MVCAMAYPMVGACSATSLSSTNVTTIECHKQVRSWRLLRLLMEFLIPTCNCAFAHDQNLKQKKSLQSYYNHSSNNYSSTITGTLFRYKRGKVNFCIQTNSMSTIPVLLLELAVPTNILAKEMQGGRLRIVFESPSTATGSQFSCSTDLLSTPVWNMHCNGKKVGYAVKRKPSKSDLEAMRRMSEVVVGTGVIRGKELKLNGDDHDEQLLYLRANFERVCGSANSESLHVFDPEGNIGQELSLFFCRSTRSN